MKLKFGLRIGLLFGGCFCFSLLAACGSDSSSGADSNGSKLSSSADLPIAESSSSGDDLSSSSALSSSSLFVHQKGFSPCQFNFGAGWQAAHEDSAFYDGLDYISVWLGDNDYFNSFEERMFDMTRVVHATPMIYAYVIAEFGKDHGLDDCDVKDSQNLCTDGAELMRQYFQDSILYRYRQYAAGFREHIEIFYPEQNPDTIQFIWLIEPDYYQYSESGSNQKMAFDSIEQRNGGIPDAQMGLYFAQIVDTIRAYLPGSKIAIDISPWIADVTEEPDKMANWYANFDLSKVDFASTSGGRTAAANERIRSSNKATWAGVAQLLQRPILADAGYDAGGYGSGYNKAWGVVENLNARIADGVIGVTQMDPDSLYHVRATIARNQLNAIPWCAE